MTRPSKENGWSEVALVISRWSTCHRLPVGCVLVDEAGLILSTGYNGRAAGLPHCNESGIDADVMSNWELKFPHRCKNSDAPIGKPNGCESIHAEQNALMQCSDVRRIKVCYVTHSPCLSCVKMLLNTGCRRIVFTTDYPSGGARELWEGAGRGWIHRGP